MSGRSYPYPRGRSRSPRGPELQDSLDIAQTPPSNRRGLGSVRRQTGPRVLGRQDSRYYEVPFDDVEEPITNYIVPIEDEPITIDPREGLSERARQFLDFNRMEFLNARLEEYWQFMSSRLQTQLFTESNDSRSEMSWPLAQFSLVASPRRRKPSKKELQEKIMTLRVAKHQLTEPCSICLCEYKLCQRASELPCKHLFHRTCLGPWLKQSGSCPVCRQPIIQ